MSTFAIIAGCIVGVSIALLLLLVYTIGHMRGSCGRCSICKEWFAARAFWHIIAAVFGRYAAKERP